MQYIRTKSGVCINIIFWQVAAKLFHSLVVRRLDKHSKINQSLTSTGGQSDGPNIFFKTWLTSESFFPYCLLSPKDCIFHHQLCPKWKRHALTSKPDHTVVTALWMAVSKSAYAIVGKTFTPRSAASDTAWLIHPHTTSDVYWPVTEMQVAHSESMNCK